MGGRRADEIEGREGRGNPKGSNGEGVVKGGGGGGKEIIIVR
jgi:hypothetical protein